MIFGRFVLQAKNITVTMQNIVFYVCILMVFKTIKEAFLISVQRLGGILSESAISFQQ